VKEFYEEIRSSGPSQLKNDQTEYQFMLNLSAAESVASAFRLRVLLGREKDWQKT